MAVSLIIVKNKKKYIYIIKRKENWTFLFSKSCKLRKSRIASTKRTGEGFYESALRDDGQQHNLLLNLSLHSFTQIQYQSCSYCKKFFWINLTFYQKEK